MIKKRKREIIGLVESHKSFKANFSRFKRIADKYFSKDNAFDIRFSGEGNSRFKLTALDEIIEVIFSLSMDKKGKAHGRISFERMGRNGAMLDTVWVIYFDELGSVSEHSPTGKSMFNILNPKNFEDIIFNLLDNLLQLPCFRAQGSFPPDMTF